MVAQQMDQTFPRQRSHKCLGSDGAARAAKQHSRFHTCSEYSISKTCLQLQIAHSRSFPKACSRKSS